jgi:CheY-like chemotaxis protein
MEQANTVLVVEDEADIRNLVAINLRRAGFEVLTAEDGTRVCRSRSSSTPPVVVLDLMLPDMSGLRDLRPDPRVEGDGTHPVLMLTARTEEDDKNRRASRQGPTTTSPSRSAFASSCSACRPRRAAPPASRRGTPMQRRSSAAS